MDISEARAQFELYTPNLPAEEWATVRPIVRTCVDAHFRSRGRAGRGPRNAPALAQALTHLVGFFDWVYVTGLVPLAPDSLCVDTINAYTVVRSSEVKSNVAERERKVLLVFAGAPASCEKRPNATTSTPDAPYAASALSRIYAWAQAQPDELRRRNCSTIATLSLGCGLTTGEIATARVSDIEVAADGLSQVRVLGARSRVVPVTNDWADRADTLRSCGDPEQYLLNPGATVRDKSTVMYTLRASIGDITPTPQRLRNTWIVNHLNAGTPINLLAALAGLKTPDAFRRLMPYMQTLDPKRSLELARLTGGAM